MGKKRANEMRRYINKVKGNYIKKWDIDESLAEKIATSRWKLIEQKDYQINKLKQELFFLKKNDRDQSIFSLKSIYDIINESLEHEEAKSKIYEPDPEGGRHYWAGYLKAYNVALDYIRDKIESASNPRYF